MSFRRARFPGRAIQLFLTALLFASLAAAQPPVPPAPGQQPPETATPPAKAKEEIITAAAVDPKTYIIGAEDVLQIRVWREGDLSGNVTVRPDGRITLPLAGEVDAAGLTPDQLTQKVIAAFSKYLNKPEVFITVMSVQSKRYFISGQVGRSGPVPLVTPTTILQALSLAGFRDWAKKNKIVIMRGTQRIKFNYNEVIKGKKLEQNIYLQDADHIYVP